MASNVPRKSNQSALIRATVPQGKMSRINDVASESIGRIGETFHEVMIASEILGPCDSSVEPETSIVMFTVSVGGLKIPGMSNNGDGAFNRAVQAFCTRLNEPGITTERIGLVGQEATFTDLGH